MRLARFVTQPRECCVRFMSTCQDTKLSRAWDPCALRASPLTAGIIFNEKPRDFENLTSKNTENRKYFVDLTPLCLISMASRRSTTSSTWARISCVPHVKWPSTLSSNPSTTPQPDYTVVSTKSRLFTTLWHSYNKTTNILQQYTNWSIFSKRAHTRRL